MIFEYQVLNSRSDKCKPQQHHHFFVKLLFKKKETNLRLQFGTIIGAYYN